MLSEGDIKGVITKRWSARAQSYDCSPGHGIHSDGEKQTWLEVLADALDKKKKLKTLDVGTGALALLLAEMGHEVFGIDLSGEMLKRAQKKAKAKELKVTFEVGDAENPPFTPGSLDAIVSRHLLWTLPNPEKAVRAWNILLKPGGISSSSTVISNMWLKRLCSRKRGVFSPCHWFFSLNLETRGCLERIWMKNCLCGTGSVQLQILRC